MIRFRPQNLCGTLLFTLVLLTVCGALCAQSFTSVLTFQGRLCEPNGKPLPDGGYLVQFKIYDAETDGNVLWEETQNVRQVTGVFSVYLGEQNPLPPDLFDNGDRWLALQIVGDEEIPERFRFTPSPWALYAQVSGSAVPRGGIIMWSGSLESVPEGWQLCDGTNGTPDLRDRFILSVAAGENPGGTGGAHTHALSQSEMPGHGHSFTTNPAGTHSHKYNLVECEFRDVGTWFPDKKIMVYHWTTNGWTSTEGLHSHSGTTNMTGGSQPFDNRPAYYKLAYIMKL